MYGPAMPWSNHITLNVIANASLHDRGDDFCGAIVLLYYFQYIRRRGRFNWFVEYSERADMGFAGGPLVAADAKSNKQR